MKHHSLAVDFSNLDFEKIDIEILADKVKEQEEADVDAVGGKDAVVTGRTDLGRMDEAVAPST